MTEDDLSRPAPEGLTAADIDVTRIHAELTELIVRERGDLMSDMLDGRLYWHLDPFDAQGWTTISLRRKGLDEDTEVGAQAHWTTLVKR
jgi:hypothetical protein